MKDKIKNIFGILGAFEKGNLKVESIGFFKALGVIVLWQIFSIVPQLISTLIYDFKNEYYMIPIAFIISVICSLILIFLLFRIYSLPKISEEKRGVKTKKLVIFSILLLFGYRIFYVGTFEHIINRIPVPEFMEELMRMLEVDNIQAIDFLLNSIFIAPLVEEVVNRGIIFNGLRRKYSDRWAILLSSFLFAFFHLNLQQGINAFIIGVIFAWVYIKTNSIYLCIALHAFNNFIVNPMYYIIGEDEKGVIASIIYAILGAAIMYVGFKYFKKEKDKIDKEDFIEIIEF